MTISRKHLEAVALNLSKASGNHEDQPAIQQGIAISASCIADVFEDMNPCFDRKRFLVACENQVNSRTYYTLVVNYDGQWGAEFGDYDKSVVTEELRDAGYSDKHARVIKSGDKQHEIDAAIGKLNL